MGSEDMSVGVSAGFDEPQLGAGGREQHRSQGACPGVGRQDLFLRFDAADQVRANARPN